MTEDCVSDNVSTDKITWRDFPRGTRVEVRIVDGPEERWVKGTVMENYDENNRGIYVQCDEVISDNYGFYDGKGFIVSTMRERDISHVIKKIPEPMRVVPLPYSQDLKDAMLYPNAQIMLQVLQAMAGLSNGRLRVSFNEERSSTKCCKSGVFLKKDRHASKNSLEYYSLIGNVVSWKEAFMWFSFELIKPLKNDFPESYSKAKELLWELTAEIYPEENLRKEWIDLI